MESDFSRPQHCDFLDGQVVAYTHRAPRKETVNEDALALIPVNESSGIMVVCDGVGGLPAGQLAARTVIESLQHHLAAIHGDQMRLRDAILDALDEANRTILSQGNGNATTTVIAEVRGCKLRCYHVGDSAALLCGQRGRLKYQSIVHSPVGYGIESGLLDEQAALSSEDRNIVSNVVGARDMRIEIGPVITISPRDTLLLGSDGLFDNFYSEELIDHIRCGELQHQASGLLEVCQQRMHSDQPHSHADDLTFVMFRRGAVPRRQ